MDVSEQKLEVVRKLLTKAERAATPDEADAYNAKAAELMARHGVDSAMLAAAGGGPPDEIGRRRLVMSDPYSNEKSCLAVNVARALGCQAVRHAGHRRGQINAVTLIGFRSDMDRAELVFTSLLLQATRSLVHQRPSRSYESTAAFRRTWLLGFGNEAYRRLDAAENGAVRQRDAADASGPSAALVVADRRSLVQQRFDEEYGHLGKGRRRTLTGSGYSAPASRQVDEPTSATPACPGPDLRSTGRGVVHR